MKKGSVLFFALLLSAASITAKELPIVGKWLLTVAEMDGQAQEVYSKVVFKEDGYAEMDGRVFGTWSYDKKSKAVTIKSEMIEEFAGQRTVSKPSKGEMVFSGDGLKLFFVKLDEEKIIKENAASGLMGLWQFSKDEETTYIKFEAPDEVSYYAVSEYSTSSGGGTWMYNKAKQSVILMVNNRDLSGNSKVEEITSKSFKILKDGNAIEASKIEQGGVEIEKLSFTQDDIYETLDDRTVNVTFDGTEFLWNNPEAKSGYLKNIKELTYAQSEFIPKLNAYISNDITTGVTYDEDYGQINMEPLFGELSAQDYVDDNVFYPLEIENSYRITGEKQVTVPAGTFTCKVVESVGGYGDLKVKLYMISNRPGVYAKIVINEGEGEELTSKQYVLSNIESTYTTISNDIIGKWLLIKTEENGRKRKVSREMEFVNDGRYIVNRKMGTWQYADKLVLDSYGEITEFTVAELSKDKLTYTNGEVTLYFVKWEVASNATSPLVGYWSLLEGGYDMYSLIHLTKDSKYYDIAHLNKMPLEDNYPRLVGQWMHNVDNTSLTLKITDDQAILVGGYGIEKLENDIMVLENGIVYVKIDPDLIAKNNAASGLMGSWKIEVGSDQFFYFNLESSALFKGGNSADSMYATNLWFYNPDTKMFFAGVETRGFGGMQKVEITADTITFESGRVATRIK